LYDGRVQPATAKNGSMCSNIGAAKSEMWKALPDTALEENEGGGEENRTRDMLGVVRP
jgi:hypothetical protein